MKKFKRKFVFIELIIAIVVMSILTGIALPKFIGIQKMLLYLQ